MTRPVSPLQTLAGAQATAAAPDAHVWLSASAGTGKTHVLTARVFRLLLRGVSPQAILCLTFTKAGAAEMADRIHDRLAGWVQMSGPALAQDLMALGEDHGPAMQDRARRLFAQVLESTGGGLRIQTIHSFCQQLLASFPLEAGLVPGFRALDGREQALLARQTLADLVTRAEDIDDDILIDALQALSLRLGEGAAESFLLRCGGKGQALADLPDVIAPWLRERLDLPPGDVEAVIAATCADDRFDIRTLEWIAAANAQWGTGRGLERCDRIAHWRALSPEKRATGLADLHGVWAKADGDLISTGKGWAPQIDGYADAIARMHAACADLITLRARAAYSDLLAQALHAGRAYAVAYADAKRVTGAVDFDDLIARASDLLVEDGMADWIRYKLDQQIDHILVDEAQDTNIRQWQIVGAIATEFFAVAPDPDTPLRSLFTVGDYKQAIFGFQGTSPQNFSAAQTAFQRYAETAGQDFHALNLDRSFRSTPAVLEVVDRTIALLSSDRLGLAEGSVQHISANRFPGEVLLWKAIAAGAPEDAEGEENWAADQERTLATRIARQIRQWIDDGLMLESKGRAISAGDIMILVRRRSELARLIVARLYEEGVAIAGIDRLRLNAPLAVRDLLAALRFAVQPQDDLNLANLLVSPLVGWSQDTLFAHAFGRKGRLWPHLVATCDAQTLAPLADLLALADFTTPYRYLEHMLSGPMDGRRRLMERLGAEARDPIEELLSAALSFESSEHPSLQRFIDWFDRGDVEIVRDAAAQGDAVRILTVHGAKGLQAPLVILADAAIDPDASNRLDRLEWEGLPILAPRADERAGPIAELVEQETRIEREEHWRLLYVALTRAEEKLVIAGSLGPRAKGEVKPESWFGAVEAALEALGARWTEHPLWGGIRSWRGTQDLAPRKPEPASRRVEQALTLPSWLHAPAPQEARPPRPLAPSASVEDDVPNPPPTPAMRQAAERGRMLHALFERLPAVAPDDRRAVATAWLARVAPDMAAADIVDHALAVIEDPRFAALFSPQALAEAPIAAVVGEAVIAGTVDRLHVTDTHVQVVDFKTGRAVPATAGAVPIPHLRQMAAYAAALGVIFPGRVIEAALLYSSGPTLIPLDDALLGPHKPGYVPAQDIL